MSAKTKIKTKAKTKTPAAAETDSASAPFQVTVPQCGPAALARYRLIHDRLNRGVRVTAVALAKEFGMCERNVRRDLDALENSFGMPIIRDRSAKTYLLEHSCSLFPQVKLETAEALSITLFYYAFIAWAGPSYGHVLKGGLQKVSVAVGGQVKLLDNVPGGVHLPAGKLRRADYKFLSIVYDAMSHNQVLRIVYRNIHDTKSKERDIHPLFISHSRKLWNVYAYDRLRNDYRTFVLCRIRRAKKTGETFVRSPDFDAAETIRYNVGAYTGKEKHIVRVALHPFAADYLRERPWHEKQRFKKMPDGRIMTTLRVNNLVEIEQDILALGDQAEVLGPPALRERIGQIHERAAAPYRKEAAKSAGTASSSVPPLPPSPASTPT